MGPASIPKRPSVRTKAASFNQLASRSRLLKLFWHPCVVAIWPDILHCILPQICGIIAFPLKVFTERAGAEREGSFLFIAIFRQSNDCRLKDDYCDLQLCCSVVALVSAPLLSSLSSEPSGPSLVSSLHPAHHSGQFFVVVCNRTKLRSHDFTSVDDPCININSMLNVRVERFFAVRTTGRHRHS